MKKSVINPYSQCLCGSGNKYKFCCYKNIDKEFHNSNELNIYIQQNKPKLSLCIHEDCNCKGKIIKSHSIQNKKIISKLSVDNHVYMVDFSENSGIAGNDFKKIGRNDATTSKSFCSYHDNEIFKPIEHFDYCYTEEQNFLYAYRAFSKHYFDITEQLNIQRLMFKTLPNKYMHTPTMITYLKGLNIEQQKLEELKDMFNHALDAQEFFMLKTYVINFDYEIKFATSYMAPLSYDLAGNQISNLYSLEDDMKYIFVSMFPENLKTYILISWLSKDNEYIEKFINELESLKNNRDELINVLNNLLVSQTDNFVISPILLEKWDERKKEKFLTLFSATFLGMGSIENLGQKVEQNLKSYHCKFNLFEKI